MDDFLHNLRSGKLKHTDRGTRHYAGQYKNGQRKITNYQQRRDLESKEAVDRLNAIKDVLDSLAENQQRMAKAYESRNRAEERKARAFEVLAVIIHKMINPEATDIESLFAPLVAENTSDMDETATTGEDILLKGIENASESSADSLGINGEQFEEEKSADDDRRELLELIDTLRAEGTSWVKIASEINAQGFSTLSGRGIWRGPMAKKFYETTIAEA